MNHLESLLNEGYTFTPSPVYDMDEYGEEFTRLTGFLKDAIAQGLDPDQLQYKHHPNDNGFFGYKQNRMSEGNSHNKDIFHYGAPVTPFYTGVFGGLPDELKAPFELLSGVYNRSVKTFKELIEQTVSETGRDLAMDVNFPIDGRHNHKLRSLGYPLLDDVDLKIGDVLLTEHADWSYLTGNLEQTAKGFFVRKKPDLVVPENNALWYPGRGLPLSVAKTSELQDTELGKIKPLIHGADVRTLTPFNDQYLRIIAVFFGDPDPALDTHGAAEDAYKSTPI